MSIKQMEITVNKTIGSISLLSGDVFTLSKNECLILELLYSNAGRIISNDNIGRNCWPGRVVSAVSVPVAIKHIRDVLKNISGDSLIITHKGEGYSFDGLLSNNFKISFIDLNEQTSATNNKPNSKSYTFKKSFFFYFIFTVIIALFCFAFFSETNSISSYCDPSNKTTVVVNYPETQVESSIFSKLHQVMIFNDDLGCVIVCDEKECIENVK